MTSSAADARPRRAAWVWDQPDPAELGRWCAASGVTELFLAVPTDLTGSPRLAWLRAVRALLPDGVGTALLGGDPGWLDEPDEALRWWASATGPGAAEVVHLDLEPWAHPGWTGGDRDRLVRAYLSLLTGMVGRGVPVEVDLAHHLHTVRTDAGRRLDAAVLDVVAAVTLLAYRRRLDGPDGLVDVAGPTLGAALAAGCPVRVGVECTDLGPEPDRAKQTFHGRPESELRDVLDQLEVRYGRDPAWRGTAVHDRRGWVALPR
jgi:hypothetical protein